MTDKALAVTFVNPAGGKNSYWLRMELVEEERSTMTVGEAADFIDALYDTDLCAGENDNEPRPEPTAENWLRGFSTVDLPQCNEFADESIADPGSYDVQLKVYRSHQDERYKLLFSNGVAAGPMRIEETVYLTLAVDNVSFLLLDVPVLRNFRAAWTDIDGPSLELNGNLIYWSGVVTGTIRVEFVTVYDLWAVHVTGIYDSGQFPADGSDGDNQWLGVGWYSGDEDGSELTDVQNTECAVLAFYHYQYELMVLDKPELDESVTDLEAAELCYYAGYPGSTDVLDCIEKCEQIDDDNQREDCLGKCPDPSDDWDIAACKESCAERYSSGRELESCLAGCERDCFTRKRYDTTCICGGDTSVQVIQERIPCPGGYNTGSNVGRTVDSGTRYIDCGADEVGSPDFYVRKCCVPWESDEPLPSCFEKHGVYTGKPLTEEQRAAIKQHYGADANIIMVGPATTVCGEQVTTQDVPNVDCCDAVPPLTWNYDTSATVIQDYSSGIVAVVGGQLPIAVSVRGSGFWLDAEHTVRDGVTSSRAFVIYTSDACGSARIFVDDGCSSVTGFTTSPDGQWSDSIEGVAASGMTGQIYSSVGDYLTYIGDFAGIRQFENRIGGVSCGSGEYCSPTCYNFMIANTPCPLVDTGFAECVDNITIYSNKEIARFTSPVCLDSPGVLGLLANGAGYGTSFSCTCRVGNFYQEWLC